MKSLASDVQTLATAAVDSLGIEYRTVTIGRVASAEEAAEARGIALSQLIKTLVVRESDDQYYFVLIPGDRAIDWPKLRAHIGVSRLSMPPAQEAFAVTGYERGTITPVWSDVCMARHHGRTGSGERRNLYRLRITWNRDPSCSVCM